MVEQISPISDNELKMAQLLGDDYLAPSSAVENTSGLVPGQEISFSGNIFENIFSKAIESLNGVSQTENYANQMVDRYLRGEVELHEVMVAQSKASVMVQLAVTTVNSAVTTFKEITQMQV